VVNADAPSYPSILRFDMNLASRGISMISIRTAVFSTMLAIVFPALSGCGDDANQDRVASRSTPAGTSSSSTANSLESEPKTPEESPQQTEESDDASRKRPDLPNLPKGSGKVDPDAPEDFTETESGLRYRILRQSDGQKPQVNDRVVADYKGWLDGGKEFDSSYSAGKPLPFTLKTGRGGVIAGWVEGLQFVGVGGMIELEIPSALGYGRDGYPGLIPPNATLHFVVELKKIQ
jgi:FKBP-type peptidyl-prolyl cis-trans isomerase FkpA